MRNEPGGGRERRRGGLTGSGAVEEPDHTPSPQEIGPTMIPRKLATLGTALVVLTIGAAPILTSAADHLDAPALGGATANGQIAPHSEHGDRDINDVYVFPAPDGRVATRNCSCRPAQRAAGSGSPWSRATGGGTSAWTRARWTARATRSRPRSTASTPAPSASSSAAPSPCGQAPESASGGSPRLGLASVA